MKNELQIAPTIAVLWMFMGLPLALIITRLIVGCDYLMTDIVCYSTIGIWAAIFVIILIIAVKQHLAISVGNCGS